MGTTSIPIEKLRKNMSTLWKLLAILVIIQATGKNAKQIQQNDLTFDDTFDIDQFDDEASAKLRSARDLDVSEIDTEAPKGSWLMQSVKRELGHLFGSDEIGKSTATTLKKHHKSIKHHSKKVSEKTQPGSGGVVTTTKAKGGKKLNNRQSYTGSSEEGSGDDDDNDNEAIGDHKFDTWQTMIIVKAPWLDGYRVGKSDAAFVGLEHHICLAFNNFASVLYGDEEGLLRISLINVDSTSDVYKIVCIVQVELPEKWSNYGTKLKQQLTKYKRIGELSADADSSYYFRRVSDKNQSKQQEVEKDSEMNMLTKNSLTEIQNLLKQQNDFNTKIYSILQDQNELNKKIYVTMTDLKETVVSQNSALTDVLSNQIVALKTSLKSHFEAAKYISLFPLESEENLIDFDNMIDTENKSEIVSSLKRVLGSKGLQRGICNVFSNKLLLEYNTRGIQSKKRLMDFKKIMNVLFLATSSEESTDLEFIGQIRKAIKAAKNTHCKTEW